MSAYEYFDKAAAGAGFMTIAVGHVLDVIEAVLGDITEIDARTELLWPEVKLVDTGTTTTREVPDHLDAILMTSSGAPVGVQVLAGVPVSDARFSLEVRGVDGWLKLTGDHPAGVQVGDLALTSSVDFEEPDSAVATGTGPAAAEIWTGAAINVGEVYASLARDIADGPATPLGLLMPHITAGWSPGSSEPHEPASESRCAGRNKSWCPQQSARTPGRPWLWRHEGTRAGRGATTRAPTTGRVSAGDAPGSSAPWRVRSR